MSLSRVPYAMALKGFLPKMFGRGEFVRRAVDLYSRLLGVLGTGDNPGV